MWKRAKVLKVEDEGGLQRIFLKKESGDIFVILEYRTGKVYTVGELCESVEVHEVDDYVGPKTGKTFPQFSTEHKTTGTSTFVPKDAEPSGEVPKIETLTLAETISLAGAALNLKANPATTTSLDECTQAVLGYAIKLMNK
jgi:hypothetical protein